MGDGDVDLQGQEENGLFNPGELSYAKARAFPGSCSKISKFLVVEERWDERRVR